MDACINKDKQFLEDQSSAKSAMEHSKEQKRVHTARKYIKISYNSLSASSSYDLLKTSSDDSSDSGTRQK